MKMWLCVCWLFIAITHKSDSLLSNNFNGCLEYFYKNEQPTGFQNLAKSHCFNLLDLPDGIKPEYLTCSAFICQTHKMQSYFATLYDRGRRIPLYSAYIMQRKPGQVPEAGRSGFFKVEPQLVYQDLDGNMLPEVQTKSEIGKYNKQHNIIMRNEKNRQQFLLQTSQALDFDYNNSGYERGHLNPFGHYIQKYAGEATFTLTNVVPMKSSLNTIWSKYEDEMVIIAGLCVKMYVVVGIVPGNNKLNSRVNIPSHVWNAYCCVDNKGDPIKSGAAIEENVSGDVKKSVKPITIDDLQNILKGQLEDSPKIVIFKDNCAKKQQNRDGKRRSNSV